MCVPYHRQSMIAGKLRRVLQAKLKELEEGTLVSYTPPKLFTCCQRHMHAPQPRPRRLSWSSPPSPAALVSRPSAAPRAAPRPGPWAAPRVRSRRTGARARKRARATGSSSRARATAACRSAPAAPSRCRAGKEQWRHGSSTEPPSSTSEACGRQEDVSQLTCFARRPAGCWEMDCQRAGGQRRRAPVSSSLVSAEPLSGCSPLRKVGRSTARCARGLYGGP